MRKGGNNYPIDQKKASLVDALDKVIDKGAYLGGDLTIGVADIDLLVVGVRLLIASTSTLEEKRMKKRGTANLFREEMRREDQIYIDMLTSQLAEVERNLQKVSRSESQRAIAERTERDIAKLVLTIVELIRQLMEREALRRIDRGLTDRGEVEKLGLTFRLLERKIAELKAVFGIKDDLNVDLGPLGKLL